MLFDKKGTDISIEDSEISLEATSEIMEMIMLEGLDDDELDEFLQDQSEVSSALDDEVLTERTIVRLDKKAKLSRAQKMAIFQIAKEKKDPKFKKLIWVWKMERFLKDYLVKKYNNEGTKRAKQVIAKKSKSPMVAKAINRVKKQFNKTDTKKK